MASSVRMASLLLIILSSAIIGNRLLFPIRADNDPSDGVDGLKTAFDYATSIFSSSFRSFYDGAIVSKEEPVLVGSVEGSLDRRYLKEGFIGIDKGINFKNFFGKKLGTKDEKLSSDTIKENTPIPTAQKHENKKIDEIKRQIHGRNITLPSYSFVSPANGTDVLTHPIAVIKCSNQTLCIQPKLQLIPTYDVYFCKHVGHGVRFYFLAKEGLLLHPNIRLVEDINSADVIVYLPVSAPWEKSECSKPEYKSKTVVLDEGDGPHLFEPDGKNYY